MTKNRKPVKIVIAPRKSGKKKKTRSARRIEGEVTRLGGALRTLGGLGGGALGSMVGMGQAGGALGTSLGASLSRWLGSGAYTVTRNSIVNRVDASGTIPAMHSVSQSIIVRHKEYLGPITGSTTFSVLQSLTLNPGDSSTFPWLAGVANRFQEYRILGAVFHYVPTSGTAISGTNPSLGSVMLQTSYRSSDTAPANKQEMLNEYWSSEAAPSEAFCHPIECDPKENPFNVQYVRSGTVPTGDSKLLYDLGVTHVAVQGQLATGNTLGDLWLSYEVELKKPVVSSNATSTYKAAQLTYNGTITTTSKFTTLDHTSGNLAVSATANTVTLPKGAAGTWLILIRLYASGGFTAADLSGSITVTNGAVVPMADTATYSRTALGGSPTTNAIFFYTNVLVTDPTLPCTVVVPDGSWTGTVTQTTLIVCPSTSY